MSAEDEHHLTARGLYELELKVADHKRLLDRVIAQLDEELDRVVALEEEFGV